MELQYRVKTLDFAHFLSIVINPLINKSRTRIDTIFRKKRCCNIFMRHTESYWDTKINEEADQMAKGSLNMALSNMKVLHTDFRPTINRANKEKWRQLWKKCQNNNLHNIQPIISYRYVVDELIMW